jgi:hypothetical protein
MPKAGFESAITASERSKTVHASDRSATATGGSLITTEYIMQLPMLSGLRMSTVSVEEQATYLRVGAH